MSTGRELFRPRLPELPTQCASCPFRKGNDAEFGVVVDRLRKKEGIPGKATKADIGFARLSLLVELKNRGDFVCHGTAYDSDMNPNPPSKFRQCPGATTIYRTGKLPK